MGRSNSGVVACSTKFGLVVRLGLDVPVRKNNHEPVHEISNNVAF